jgi:autophagy-related protein 33
LANACFLFAYGISPPRRKHPYLLWMCATSTLASFGLDFWFNRQIGLQNWFFSVLRDTTCLTLGRKSSAKKEEDLVVVEAEEDVNGETIQREMVAERRLQCVRAWLSGIALSMGIVGLWGDRS